MMKQISRGVWVFLWMVMGASAFAQNEAQNQPQNEVEQLREQMNILREEQLRMRQELEQIKAYLMRQAQAAQADPHQGKTIRVEGQPFKGDPQAKLTVVEFSDFQ